MLSLHCPNQWPILSHSGFTGTFVTPQCCLYWDVCAYSKFSLRGDAVIRVVVNRPKNILYTVCMFSLCLNSETSPVSFSLDCFLTPSLNSGWQTLLHSLGPPVGGCPCPVDCQQYSSSLQVPEGSGPQGGEENPACGPKSSTCTASGAGTCVGTSPPLWDPFQTLSLYSPTELCECQRSCWTCVSSRYTCP